MTRPRRPGGLLRPRVPIWFSARGPIHVYQMSDRHLLNAIRCVEDQRARAPTGSAVHNMLLAEWRRRAARPEGVCPFGRESYAMRKAKVRRLESVLCRSLERLGKHESLALRELTAMARGEL